ncbi:hypothetical protein EZV62_007193 [Acer yangbiense]|uniref:NADP-dependent oxidoreductase domain-containing protein n=1 Tax=Acer yangbiense TaxID=1000413 RepID=A0A5C7I9V8_9ROSI|nr:hypothetical protein EZV62_007193 [Acer yangbiense]
MGLSGNYNDPVPEDVGISIIKHAFDHGITFFDTSDVYGANNANEILVGKALKQLPSCCEASLKRLDIEYIDLYYQHRIDTSVPIEDTMGELKKLVEEGKIKYIGLSEASPDTIRRANAVHPITAIQMEWSLWTRDIEEEIVPLCRELGIGIVPYSPLGKGFFGGRAVVERTTKIKNLDNNTGCIKVKLTNEDLQEISAVIPINQVAGGRTTDIFLHCSWKNGLVVDARDVFDSMPEQNDVSCSAMISGVLNACAAIGAFKEGKWIHDIVHENGFEYDLELGTALIDFYAKCGCIEDVCEVFDKMPCKV